MAQSLGQLKHLRCVGLACKPPNPALHHPLVWRSHMHALRSSPAPWGCLPCPLLQGQAMVDLSAAVPDKELDRLHVEKGARK